MQFFALKRKTAPSMKKRSREIKQWRYKLCKKTFGGDNVMDSILDLQAHGIFNLIDIHKHCEKNGQNALCDTIDYSRFEKNPTIKQINWRFMYRFNRWIVLIVMFLGLSVGTVIVFKSLNNQHMCSIDLIRSRLDQTVNNLVDGSPSLKKSLVQFGEDITYDWRDSENLADAPNHAVSLRIQGTSTSSILNFVERFLKNWFGSECMNYSVKFIKLNDTKNAHNNIRQFLLKVKYNNPKAIALIVIFHDEGMGEASADFINSLKDYLWMKQIVVSNTPPKSISSRGVGFIFLGGDMNITECQECNLIPYDAKLGWNENLLGRVYIRSCLC